MKKKLYKFKTFIFLLIIFYLISYFCFWFYDNYQNKKIYNNFSKPTFNEEESIIFNPPVCGNDTTYNYIDTPFLNINLNEFKNQNNDTVAYLVIDGADISYPVVQTNNNDFYLNHDFNKNYNKSGSIFSDYRNNLNNLNKNSIIYGHRRLDNSMFTNLKLLLNEDWFNEKNHHLIYLNTNNYKMIFQIFSVYTIPSESEYIKTHFINNEFVEFVLKMQERSFIKFNTVVNSEDKILTLSTCLDSLGINRIVIHSKLIKKERIN